MWYELVNWLCFQKKCRLSPWKAYNEVWIDKWMLSTLLCFSRLCFALPSLFRSQEVEYQRAMQRRAIRDAKTPEKMKQAKPVVDDSLTLQGKKDKIKSNLQRLGELGKVHPENRYQDLINDIAKVTRLDMPVVTVTATLMGIKYSRVEHCSRQIVSVEAAGANQAKCRGLLV